MSIDSPHGGSDNVGVQETPEYIVQGGTNEEITARIVAEFSKNIDSKLKNIFSEADRELGKIIGNIDMSHVMILANNFAFNRETLFQTLALVKDFKKRYYNTYILNLFSPEDIDMSEFEKEQRSQVEGLRTALGDRLQELIEKIIFLSSKRGNSDIYWKYKDLFDFIFTESCKILEITDTEFSFIKNIEIENDGKTQIISYVHIRADGNIRSETKEVHSRGEISSGSIPTYNGDTPPRRGGMKRLA